VSHTTSVTLRSTADPCALVDVWLEERRYTVRTRRIYVTETRRAERWLDEHRGIRLLDASTADLTSYLATRTTASARNARKALVAFYTASGHDDGGPARWVEFDREPRPEAAKIVVTPKEHAVRRFAPLDELARWRRELRGFERWLIQRRYADKTVGYYLRHAARCSAVLNTDLGVALDDATIDDLEHYWNALASKVSVANPNQARASLIAYYRYRGRRHGEPADELPSLPDRERLPRALDDREFVALINAAADLGGDHELAGLTYAFTGCRFTELHVARWSAFDLDGVSPSWRIVGKGSGRKGPKERVVPLRGDLVIVLRARRAASRSEFLFPSPLAPPDRPMSGPSLRKIVADITDHAGCPGVTPHRLRHTVATIALRESLDLRGVQDLLGHSNIRTTQLYTKVLPDRIRSLVETLPRAKD